MLKFQLCLFFILIIHLLKLYILIKFLEYSDFVYRKFCKISIKYKNYNKLKSKNIVFCKR